MPWPSRRFAAPLVAAAALAALFAAPVQAALPTGLSIRRVIDNDVAQPPTPFQAFDTFSLNVADLRGDGRLEMVSLNDNLHGYVLDPNTGKVLAQLSTKHGDHESTWGARDINGVAIGDVDGDRIPELVVLNGAANLTVFKLDAAATTADNFVYKPLWQDDVDALQVDHDFYARHPWYSNGSRELGADGNPAIVHLPDGTASVVAQSDGFPFHVGYSATGSIRWWDDWYDGNSGPWTGQLTAGGPAMVVFGTDGGHVVAYDAHNGVLQWDFSAPAHGTRPGSIPVAPTVADIDGSGRKVVLVGARHAVHTRADDANGTGWMEQQHAVYYLLDADGNQLWNATYDWGNPMMYMHPAVLDVDGDGVKDFVAIDWNTIGHHPGNWESTGKANLMAISGRTGQALWHTELDEPWSNKGIVVGDFLRGQGTVIVAEEMNGPADGLSVFDLQGKKLAWYAVPGPSWSITRGPVAADIDADGYADLIVPVAHAAGGCAVQLDVGCRQGALLVYATAAPDASVKFTDNLLFDSLDTGQIAVAKHAPTEVPPAKLQLGQPVAANKGFGSPGPVVPFTVALLLAAVALRRKR